MKDLLTNPLSDTIQSIIRSIDGSVGVYAHHSKRGKLFSHHEKEFFYLASTVKIPIAVQCLQRVDAGELRLDQRVDVHPSDVLSDSSILNQRHFSYPGISLSVENLIRVMMEYSDNTASDLILTLGGGIPAVRKLIEELGLTGSLSLDLSIAEAFAEELQMCCAENPLPDKKDSGTPEAVFRFLDLLSHGKLLTPSSARFLLGCMQRCKSGDDRIRALLPKDIVIANKTGFIAGYVNDVAIIELPQELPNDLRPELPENLLQELPQDLPRDLIKKVAKKAEILILVIFIKETTAPKSQAEEVIARIAKAIFEFATS